MSIDPDCCDGAAAIWFGLTPSQRVTLLCEANVDIPADAPLEALVAAGLALPGWDRPAFPSGAARHALARRGMLEVSPTVPAPGSGPGWHTPRAVTDLGRRVAEHGRALLCPATPGERMRPVTGPDGDNPITDEQIRDLRDLFSEDREGVDDGIDIDGEHLTADDVIYACDSALADHSLHCGMLCSTACDPGFMPLREAHARCAAAYNARYGAERRDTLGP